MKDIRVEIKVRNNLILTKMEKFGIPSVAELCRRLGIHNKKSEVGRLINMKEAARNDDGEWIPLALQLAEFFQCMPEDIFSGVQQEIALEKNRAHAEAAFSEIMQLGGPNREQISPDVGLQAQQLRAAISQALSKLKPREERVLRLRFGLGTEEMTLEKVGEILGLSRERVRSIEATALRKLKHPAYKKIILAAAGSSRVKSAWGGEYTVPAFDQDVLDKL